MKKAKVEEEEGILVEEKSIKIGYRCGRCCCRQYGVRKEGL